MNFNRLLFAGLMFVYACTPRNATVVQSDPAPARIQEQSPLRSLSGIAWKVQTGGGIRGNALVSGPRVYFGSADGVLYAVEKKDGTVAWTFKTRGAISSTPALAGGDVFVTSRDQHLYAVDASTGKEKWKLKMGALLPHLWGWEYFQSSPVIENQILYVGGGDGVLYAVKTSDGSVVWNFKTKGRIRATPVIHGEEIFINSFDGIFYVLEKATGKLKWTYETEGAHLKSEDFGWDRNALDATPAVEGNRVVFGSRDGNVYCLDLATKTLAWKFTYGPTWSISSPLVHNGKVFVGWSDNKLFSALDLETDKEHWKYETGDYVYSSPILAGHQVIVGGGDSKLYAFDETTGDVAWTFKTQSSVYASPVLDSMRIFVGSDDGALYALQGSSHAPVKYVAVYANAGDHPYLQGDPKITTTLQAAHVVSVDSVALKEFMKARMQDKVPSVVVFNHNSIPTNLLLPDARTGLFRNYIESGGTVLWTSFAPNLVSFDAKGNYLGENPAIANALLDMDFDLTHDGGEYSCTATAAGKRVGLPDFFIGSFSVKADAVDEVLALNEYGRAACWVRKLGAGRFIQWRTWSHEPEVTDLNVITNAVQFTR
ncbi:outer membrane protein assembly factor BamB family protein [Chryseolinea lacunae]|uniref:PQQ-binding-like beta-propeller repeat protein n=1 Tax=Chryseolinea lacunae TaxID=2801331 RepID=A0ABS1KKV7_9BACT|nr:PQQ-binding-like beta-propeller repeat protein [Chryseolinea lacunae]MBL0740103.1 PQQ-binding-like beta-propeller repeat protein [Chryseolinea lacunae]